MKVGQIIPPCILITIVLVVTQANQNFAALKNISGTSIIDGNCTNVTSRDRVFYDHVYKNAIPLFVRSETEKVYVNNTIYCVIAENQKSTETGGTANITGGGVGQKYVIIELESYRGHGLDFLVSVYGKNGTLIEGSVQETLK